MCVRRLLTLLIVLPLALWLRGRALLLAYCSCCVRMCASENPTRVFVTEVRRIYSVV
jgi:hypothetical protein